MIDTYLNVLVPWMVITAVVGAFITFMSAVEAEKRTIARIGLAFLLVCVSGLVWPLAAPVIVFALARWLWKVAEIPPRLPRAERRRIAREVATARADKVLNEILREERLR